VWREFELGIAPCPLSRYTLVHRSDKPASAAKYTIILVIKSSTSCIPELSHQIISVAQLMSHGLTSARDSRSATGSVRASPLAHHFGPRDDSCMRALRHCSPRRPPLDSMNLFVTARHDRYELACSRPGCASDDDGPVVACLLAGTVLLCPLNKPGLSERVY
jgi:hypothetical protein